MLSGPLNLARFKNGIARPFQLQHSSRHIALAEQIIDLFASSLKSKRYEIEEEIKSMTIEKVNPKVVQGLAKVLFNRCCFLDFGDSDPQALREKLFTVSAEYWASRPPLAVALQEHRKRILTDAGVEAPEAFEETDAWLFGDITSNQILKSFETIAPEQLLNRYNIEQIQGLLLNADQLTLHLQLLNEGSLRQVMQMLKFFQLMFQVTDATADRVTLKIDGPGSIFENTRSYGLEIANFFPAILLLNPPWELQATLNIPSRRRRFQLTLNQQIGLESPYSRKGVWNHQKITRLVERFNEKYGEEYEARPENQLIALSNNRYLLPDITIRHLSSSRQFSIEWIHYLSDTKLKQLLQVQRELPERYLFAVKGKRSKLEKQKQSLGAQLLVIVRELTAPALLKAIQELNDS